MTRHLLPFTVRQAHDAREVAAAQRLRHQVFVEEMGAAGGAETCHDLRREADRFDRHCHHLLLLDPLRDDEVVGTTRLLSDRGAALAGGFASEAEFDIGPLRRSGRPLLEVGRTCLHPRVRGGVALHALWRGVAAYGLREGAELLFGLASLPSGDLSRTAGLVAFLGRDHPADPDLRPRTLRPVPFPDPVPMDRRAAMLSLPPLVKAYLRLGGAVGEGAFLDAAFGCVDVCMVLDAGRLAQAARRLLPDGPGCR